MDDYLKKMQEFSKIYRSEIVPIFRIYEPTRAKLNKKQKLSNFSFIGIVLLFVSTPFLLIVIPNPEAFLVFNIAVVFSLVPLFVLNNKINKEVKNFKNMLKEQCLDKVLKVFGDIKRVDNHNINMSELTQSNIFRRPNSITYDDKYQGVYNGVPFSIIEYCAVYGSGKHRYCENKVLFITKSNKKVRATTTFQTKKAFYSKIIMAIVLLASVILIIVTSFMGGKIKADLITGSIQYIIAAVIIVASIIKSLKNKINLEDIKTQKEFFVESSDQVEGRYLLTPAFIERFKALAKTFKTKDIECSFYGYDKFMIKMDAKGDLFELCQINKSLLNIECMQRFFNEMKVIYDIIDYLKLDENVGL